MSLAKLTSKGQITLPKAIREYLELHTGDKVEFIIDLTGQVLISPKTIDIKDAFGMIKTKKTVSIEEMNKTIQAQMKRKHKHDSN